MRTDFETDQNGGVMHKLFYNRPDSALLAYLDLPADGSPIVPTISNLKFTSSSGTQNTQYANEGGTFTFNSTTENDKYIFTLDFGNGNEVKKYGTTSASNSISWDGKDDKGNFVQSGNYVAKLELFPGEVHFVLYDFEIIQDGIVIQRLNGNSQNPYTVYYNHTPQSIDTLPNNMDTVCLVNTCQPGSNTVNFAENNGWVVNAEDLSIQYVTAPLDGTNGVDSSAGLSKTANNWSESKLLDYWSYDDSIAPLNINVKVVPDEKINIRVNKLWEDENDRDGMRPSTISVKLLQNETEYNTATITGSTGNTWTYTFRNLPKYNTDGELFDYSIEEVVE